jgi:hypothetical protein
MTGNPFIDRTPFFSISWVELRDQIPLASGTQLHQAAEKLRPVLRDFFRTEAHKLAYSYERDRDSISQALLAILNDPDAQILDSQREAGWDALRYKP